MKLGGLCALLVATAIGCQAQGGHAQDERISRLAQLLASQESATASIESQAGQLSATWDDVKAGYRRAAMQSEDAARVLDGAATAYGSASQQSEAARRTAERATQRWKLFQTLVVLAATIDASNIEAARANQAAEAGRVTCETGMSTSAYRAMLSASGIALDGMDVDHIVPRSLGGADHPDNYQLLPASVNRSLGNTWNEDKCLSVGGERCARAVAISRKCGSFRSLGF